MNRKVEKNINSLMLYDIYFMIYIEYSEFIIQYAKNKANSRRINLCST